MPSKLLGLFIIIVFVLTGCSKGQRSGTNATSLSNAPVAATAVTYDDLNGVVGQKEITQLAALGVFGTASGHFGPAQPVSRREFVRWLFKANNSIWASDSNNFLHPAHSEDSAFKDIKQADPDFQYIQGLQDSGVAVGFPDKTFKPDQPITREQALDVKSALDRGGVDKLYVISEKQPGPIPNYGYYILPHWGDKQTIAPEYVGSIATGIQDDSRDPNDPRRRVDNLPRTFGANSVAKTEAPADSSESRNHALENWATFSRSRGRKRSQRRRCPGFQPF